MRIDRVKYTAHYDEFGFIKDQWVGFEGSIDDTEDPEKQATIIKEMTDKWYKENNQRTSDYPISLGTYAGIAAHPLAPSAQPIITVERTSEDVRVAKLIKDIYACTELEGENGLLSYAKVAAITSRETQQVYDIMFKKLTPDLHDIKTTNTNEKRTESRRQSSRNGSRVVDAPTIRPKRSKAK